MVNTRNGNWDGWAWEGRGRGGCASSLQRIKPERLSLRWRGPGRITMTAADAARRGYRSSLDIKKSDRATLFVFIQRLRPPAATLPLSLPSPRGEPIPRGIRLRRATLRLLSSALVKTIASTWWFRVIDSRGIVVFPPALSGGRRLSRVEMRIISISSDCDTDTKNDLRIYSTKAYGLAF